MPAIPRPEVVSASEIVIVSATSEVVSRLADTVFPRFTGVLVAGLSILLARHGVVGDARDEIRTGFALPFRRALFVLPCSSVGSTGSSLRCALHRVIDIAYLSA